MYSRLPALLCLGVPLWAQCNLFSQAGCPADGNTPTQAVYLANLASNLNTISAGITGVVQTHIPTSAQVTPANGSYVNTQPACNPTGSSCTYNNATTINAYVDRLVSAGVTILTINNALQMMAQASEYSPSGSDITITSDCTAAVKIAYGSSAGSGGYFCKSLQVFDTAIAHIISNYPIVTVELRPQPDTDTLVACGLSAAGGNTIAQVENCLKPLIVAAAKRYGSTVTVVPTIDVLHEPQGAFLAGVNQNFSVANVRTYVTNVASAVTSAVPAMHVTATVALSSQGGSPDDQNYWDDWTSTQSLYSVLNGFGFDIYGGSCDLSGGQYATQLAGFVTNKALADLINKPVSVKESARPRWCPSSGSSSESHAIQGCGWPNWGGSTGADTAWQTAFYRWGAANGFTGVSVFASEPMVYYATSTSAPNNCVTGAYTSTVMSNLSAITVAGSNWALLGAGSGSQMQGQATLSGQVRMGN